MITDKKKIIIACLLLLSTVLISLPTLHNGSFGDEFDTLAAAKLMTKGNILYRDIFSHHFPREQHWSLSELQIRSRQGMRDVSLKT